MLISVVIPVYNGENYIKNIYQCLKTYNNIEIIFFDDSSTDNSLKILKELKKKDKSIKIYNSKLKNIQYGPSGAKNEGLKHATGEYVMFIDCDDYVSKDYIEKIANEIKKNNKPDLIITGFTKVDQNGKVLYKSKYYDDITALYQGVFIWTKTIKMKFLNENNVQLPYGPILDDVVFQAYLILLNPKCCYLNDRGYYYYYYENSQSHTVLSSFKPGSLEQAFEYFDKIANNKQIKDKNKLCYFVFKYICWHLLKSGIKVGTNAMKYEYNLAFSYLENNYPEYRKFKNIKCPYERKIVKLALYTIFILRKLHLDWLFFKIYSNINLRRLWPN